MSAPEPAVRSVDYWDEYAPWYKLWLDHTDYHRGLQALLAAVVRPGWRVLDIGGGSGVLAFPLVRIGAEVTLVEPSAAMRNLLRTEMKARELSGLRVIPLPWESVPAADAAGFDLALASNSLHLTRIGAGPALRRVLEAGPTQVLVASEAEIPLTPEDAAAADYDVAASGSFKADGSFWYHSLEEAGRHLDLKDRHGQPHPPRAAYLRSLVAREGHFVHERRSTLRWLRLHRTGDGIASRPA
ncbi:MAG: class I SAM-dependent methyltransferase [Candidatus Aminicenantes bacterium]|nr:class I SAM-dependent methyltransferase [Candidatus Aminicenantes bacterium]